MDAIKRKDGFDFSFNDLSRDGTKNVPYQVLILNKKTMFRKGIDYAIENGISQIEVNLDLKEKELLLLTKIPLRRLLIRGVKSKVDITFLNELTKLEYLSIEFNAYGDIDLVQLNNLETLNCEAANLNLFNVDKSEKLKDLFVHNYKNKILPFWGNINIENVGFYNSIFSNIDSLIDCKSVKKFTMERNPSINSINGLIGSSNSLEKLSLIGCRNFKNYAILLQLKKIKDLYISNCGAMDNASYFANLDSLKYGNIDIDILDGDVSALMAKPIIFKNYKHFNNRNNLKIKIVTNEGNYLVRDKEVLYKL